MLKRKKDFMIQVQLMNWFKEIIGDILYLETKKCMFIVIWMAQIYGNQYW